MMTNWEIIKYFKPVEFGKNGKWMQEQLMRRLDNMREYIGKVIHCEPEHPGGGYRLKPASAQDKSYHYQGLAVDIHIEGLSLAEMYLLAEKYNFTGIGVYPKWNNPGLHVDMRPVAEYGRGSRWGCTESKKYVDLDVEFLKKYVFI